MEGCPKKRQPSISLSLRTRANANRPCTPATGGRACIVLRKERKERRRGAAGLLLSHVHILPEETKERLKKV
jgi:hypothetical protein